MTSPVFLGTSVLSNHQCFALRYFIFLLCLIPVAIVDNGQYIDTPVQQTSVSSGNIQEIQESDVTSDFVKVSVDEPSMPFLVCLVPVAIVDNGQYIDTPVQQTSVTSDETQEIQDHDVSGDFGDVSVVEPSMICPQVLYFSCVLDSCSYRRQCTIY